jgi:putative aldouronate transport system permease protein
MTTTTAKTRREGAYWERRITLSSVLIYGALAVVFLITAYPFVYILSLSVMPYENYVTQPIHIGPSGFTTLYFDQIFHDSRLVRAFTVSALKTSVGTVLSVIVTVLGGYALSRPGLKFGRVLMLLFLIPLFIGAGIIPYYLNIRSLGLLNTFWALVLPGIVSPFYIFITRTYFVDYPAELLEAARIDGASQWGTFWRIVWPTSTPIIATLAMLYGVGLWNEYFWSGILVQQDLQPASVLLQNIVNNRSVLQGLGQGIQLAPQSFVAAVAALLIIPMLVLYPLLQRYVVRGIFVGSVKG